MFNVKVDEQKMIEIDPSVIPLIYGSLGINLGCSSNGWYTINCPFHNDTNPSCGVNENTGGYNCFSCSATGSIFDAIMKLNPDDGEISFVQSLDYYKKIAGDLDIILVSSKFGEYFAQMENDISMGILFDRKKGKTYSFTSQEVFWEWYDAQMIKWHEYLSPYYSKYNVSTPEALKMLSLEDDSALCHKLDLFNIFLQRRLKMLVLRSTSLQDEGDVQKALGTTSVFEITFGHHAFFIEACSKGDAVDRWDAWRTSLSKNDNKVLSKTIGKISITFEQTSPSIAAQVRLNYDVLALDYERSVVHNGLFIKSYYKF